MNEIKLGRRLAAIFLLGAFLLSACQQSVSNVPAATTTPIATGLFVTPLSGQNPMEMIEKFAQGTAAAQTAAAGGGSPTTPQAVSVTGTGITPLVATTAATTGTVIPTSGSLGTSTGIAVATTPVVGTPVTSATTPVIAGTLPTQGPKPASYTLQKGEFPYCIARRFNVNPSELLSINGLVDGELYYPNLTLKIPQSSATFPGDRALHTHPATYTVPSSSTTIYEVACYFGDVDPAGIAALNGISLSSALTSGQKLSIP